AQRFLAFGPGARVPEADGLIARGGDQPSSVPGKRQIANPDGVSFELLEKFPSSGIPDVDWLNQKSRSRSQHAPVRRDIQRGDPIRQFPMPEFLARAEVDALDTTFPIVRTAPIQTP